MQSEYGDGSKEKPFICNEQTSNPTELDSTTASVVCVEQNNSTVDLISNFGDKTRNNAIDISVNSILQNTTIDMNASSILQSSIAFDGQNTGKNSMSFSTIPVGVTELSIEIDEDEIKKYPDLNLIPKSDTLDRKDSLLDLPSNSYESIANQTNENKENYKANELCQTPSMQSTKLQFRNINVTAEKRKAISEMAQQIASGTLDQDTKPIQKLHSALDEKDDKKSVIPPNRVVQDPNRKCRVTIRPIVFQKE